MIVLEELKKSVKEFEDIVKATDKVTTIAEFDELELKAQKIVFELQMKANQVAAEYAPALMDKRTELKMKAVDIAKTKVAEATKKATEPAKEAEVKTKKSKK